MSAVIPHRSIPNQLRVAQCLAGAGVATLVLFTVPWLTLFAEAWALASNVVEALMTKSAAMLITFSFLACVCLAVRSNMSRRVERIAFPAFCAYGLLLIFGMMMAIGLQGRRIINRPDVQQAYSTILTYSSFAPFARAFDEDPFNRSNTVTRSVLRSTCLWMVATPLPADVTLTVNGTAGANASCSWGRNRMEWTKIPSTSF